MTPGEGGRSPASVKIDGRRPPLGPFGALARSPLDPTIPPNLADPPELLQTQKNPKNTTSLWNEIPVPPGAIEWHRRIAQSSPKTASPSPFEAADFGLTM